jgi:hypothetical protein
MPPWERVELGCFACPEVHSNSAMDIYGARLAVLEGQDTETAERLWEISERQCAVSERTRKSGGEKTRESARRPVQGAFTQPNLQCG